MQVRIVPTTDTVACGRTSVSAKKPKPKKRVALQDWQDRTSYVFNKVIYEEKVWLCRRSHTSSKAVVPGKGCGFWKEAV